MISKWCATCAIFRQERETDGWKQLHVCGAHGSCQGPRNDGDAVVAEALATGEEKERVARQRAETHDVFGQHGHRDGV